MEPFRQPFQRDQDVLSAEEQAALTRAVATAEHPLTRARALGALGDRWRCSGALDQAHAALVEAVALSQQAADAHAEATHRLRYAICLQYQGQHEDAVVEYEAVLGLIRRRRIKGRSHYVYQHLGKCLIEMGDIPTGLIWLQKARRARLQNQALLASTERAITAARALLLHP